LLWKVEIQLRSQPELAEFFDLNTDFIDRCKDEVDARALLWKICPEPQLDTTGNLANSPFLEIEEGDSGFSLENFDFQVWKRRYSSVFKPEDEKEFEEDFEYYYRGIVSAHIVVEAGSDKEASDLVLREAKKHLRIRTEVADSFNEPFFKIDQVSVKSVNPC
jgi:hypothetical protein